jgi:hypothetical protein
MSEARIEATWNAPEWIDGAGDGRISIVTGPDAFNGGKSLCIFFPAHAYGSDSGGAQWYMRLSKGYDDLYCSYEVRFETGFDFAQGGYLPGMSGGRDATGDTAADGVTGWSARGEFLDGGYAYQNTFNLGQIQPYGDDIPWDETRPFRYVPNVWYHVEHHVRMNTPGRSDGLLEAWVNGQQVLSRNDFVYRKVDTLKINQFMMAFFFGGDDSTFAPQKDQHVYIDDLVISRRPMTIGDTANKVLRSEPAPKASLLRYRILSDKTVAFTLNRQSIAPVNLAIFNAQGKRIYSAGPFTNKRILHSWHPGKSNSSGMYCAEFKGQGFAVETSFVLE